MLCTALVFPLRARAVCRINPGKSPWRPGSCGLCSGRGTRGIPESAAFHGSNIFLAKLPYPPDPNGGGTEGTFFVVSELLRSRLTMYNSEGSAAKEDGNSCRPTTTPPAEDVPSQLTTDAPRQIPLRSADTLIRRWKKLLQLKKQFSSPFAELIALVSGLCWLYHFIIGMGSLSYPLLGFAAVSLFALLVPEGAPRLFALRTFAFAIDALFLGILTIAILPFSYQVPGRPSEFIITCVVWLWFIYFVLFDWWFHGTPGKRMLGLKLVARGVKLSSFKSLLVTLLRTFLTLFLPVVAGIWMGNLFSANLSRIGLATKLMVQAVFQLAGPVSILVLGGNRGFADRATYTEVRIGRGISRSSHRSMRTRDWVFACTLPIAGGLAIAITGYIFGGSIISLNSQFQIPAKPTGKDLSTVLSWEDPGGVFKAACLAPGFRDLSKDVQSVQVDTLSENPFTVGNTDLVINPVDATNLAQTDGLPIIRITTTSWISPASYSMITRNLARCYGSALDEGKHSTVVIQFEQLDDYGFFILVRHQNTILGVDRKASSAYWNMTDLQPKVGASINISSDLGGYALLGRAGLREAFLNRY